MSAISEFHWSAGRRTPDFAAFLGDEFSKIAIWCWRAMVANSKATSAKARFLRNPYSADEQSRPSGYHKPDSDQLVWVVSRLLFAMLPNLNQSRRKKISFDWDEIPLVHKYEFAKINKTLKNSAITVRFMRFFEFYLFELCGITCRCKLASGRLQEGIIFHDGSQGGFL